MENNPLVSVVITCYNSDEYIGKNLDNLANQTYKNIEVIIVDDGSTDNSAKIIKSYENIFKKKGKTLKYVYQKNNGVGSAMNRGLKEIRGEYFVWIDSDDFYELDAIEQMLKFMVDGGYDYIRGCSRHIDEKNQKEIGIMKSKYPNAKNIFDIFFFHKDDYQYGGVYMVKTNFFDKVILNRNIYESKAGQNWQLLLPIFYDRTGKYGYLDKIVLNYRVTPNSMSRSAKKINEKIEKSKAHEDILMHVLGSMKMNFFKKIQCYIYVKNHYAKERLSLKLSNIKK
jgi:glycosyltransferase involved in cell wall biosynthesis